MRAGHRPTRSAASLRALAPCQIPALSALPALTAIAEPLCGHRAMQVSGQVIQVLVKRHPWGHKELAIPIGQVSGFQAGIQLSITRQEARELTV